VSAVAVVGDRAAVDAYLSSPEGRDTARALAKAVFRDEAACSEYELGLGPDPHPAVERHLQRLIAARNRREQG